MATPVKKSGGMSRYRCAKCGRTAVWPTRPLLQSTGKCPKATNGNHSWQKET